MRVAIIGGGVMGCASAFALAARGAEVVLLERSVPGAEASSAAAGMLGAQVECHAGSPMIETFARARAAYADWSRELREASGVDIGYRVSGLLRLAKDEEERASIADGAAWQRSKGLRADMLTPDEARKIEPELGTALAGAAYFPDEAQVDPQWLLRALVAAIARACPRVTVRSGAIVQRVLMASGRCTGVMLEGETLHADATVLAAGSWSSLVPGVPEALHVRPVRGQMVQLDERPPRLRTILFGLGAYLVPRGDGRVLCGSTMENVGYQRGVTVEGINAILTGTMRAAPSLAAADVTGTWSSFRPFAGDETTWLVGASDVPGLFLATGHHRNGILLAKETADRVAEAVYAA